MGNLVAGFVTVRYVNATSFASVRTPSCQKTSVTEVEGERGAVGVDLPGAGQVRLRNEVRVVADERHQPDELLVLRRVVVGRDRRIHARPGAPRPRLPPPFPRSADRRWGPGAPPASGSTHAATRGRTSAQNRRTRPPGQAPLRRRRPPRTDRRPPDESISRACASSVTPPHDAASSAPPGPGVAGVPLLFQPVRPLQLRGTIVTLVPAAAQRKAQRHGRAPRPPRRPRSDARAGPPPSAGGIDASPVRPAQARERRSGPPAGSPSRVAGSPPPRVPARSPRASAAGHAPRRARASGSRAPRPGRATSPPSATRGRDAERPQARRPAPWMRLYASRSPPAPARGDHGSR